MKKTRKAMLSAAVAIAMCTSVMAGTTYALFTSESNVNIAISSANVEVAANAVKLTKYSAVADENGEMLDELGNKYAYGAPETLAVSDGILKFENVKPGDKYELTLSVKNNSSIDVAYRTKFEFLRGDLKLMSAFKTTLDGKNVSNYKSYTGAWQDWDITDTVKTKTVTLVMEMPMNIGNAFKNLSADINVSIEALQGNASRTEAVNEQVYYVTDTAQAQAALDAAAGKATVMLAAGNYGALSLRQTDSSDVAYTLYDEADGGIHRLFVKTFERSVGELSVIGESGAIVDGFNVVTKPLGNINTSYIDNVDGQEYKVQQELHKISVDKLVIDNVALTKAVKLGGDDYVMPSVARIAETGSSLEVNDLTLRNCTMKGSGASAVESNRLLSYTGNSHMANIVVDNCTASDIWQGVYTLGNRNLTVTNCTFENLLHNAFAIQDRGDVNGGDIVISGNTVKNCNNRAVRFGKFKSGSVKIANNTFIDSGDEKGELCKAESIAAGVAVDFASNYLNGKTFEQAVKGFGEDVKVAVGATVSGIKGFEGVEFASIQDAYAAIHAKAEELGLTFGQETATAEKFNEFYTDGNITWTIYGEQHVDNEYLFSFGRKASRYDNDLNITGINIVAGDADAKLVMDKLVVLPYDWWYTNGDPNAKTVALNITGVTLEEGQATRISFEPNFGYTFNATYTDCVINGSIHYLWNNAANLTFERCAFNNKQTGAEDSYGLFVQGSITAESTVRIIDCTFDGYKRGINLQRDNTDFTVKGCTFRNLSVQDRAAIQITRGKSFTIDGNTFENTVMGSAIWFYSGYNASSTVITNNTINSQYYVMGYNGNSYKVTSSGNKGDTPHKCIEKDATEVTDSGIALN